MVRGVLLAHNTKAVLCLHISPGVLQACFRYLLVGSLFPGGLLAMSKNTMDSVSKKTPDSMSKNPMDITGLAASTLPSSPVGIPSFPLTSDLSKDTLT